MIRSVLIANRGEIACRIIRTCEHLGIRPVVVYSTADSSARHVAMADEAIHIGPSATADSYLRIERVIEAAKRAGADAIHPGYGFLAENAAFAEACLEAGLTFIGPSPQAIAVMGDKPAAKDLAISLGIPVIPGYHGPEQSDETLRREAERLGFPVMIKAAAGGGGKGMRIVEEGNGLADALAGARLEAARSFGSDRLMLEKPLPRLRHIEFQVFGDNQGNVIHLGERECSIQRRYQKIIEEAPSPALTPELREEMGAVAVAISRAIAYVGAGTVEFLLDDGGHYYFLEMNTRLQVEHPVTEMITGLDLVAWQIHVAEGGRLPLVQGEVEFRGHAVEARLYAEDPGNGFMPTTGRVLHWREPSGDKIRVESGIQDGGLVSAYYDPLLAKLISHGRDRGSAIRRLAWALENTSLLGVTSNRSFLGEVLRHPEFLAGELDTRFVERIPRDHSRAAAPDLPLALTAAALVQYVRQASPEHGPYWRNNPNRPPQCRFRVDPMKEPVEVEMLPLSAAEGSFQVNVLGTSSAVILRQGQDNTWRVTVDGHDRTVTVASHEDDWWVQTSAGTFLLQSVSLLPEPEPAVGAGGSLRAPLPGSVLEILVEVGQRVVKGQALMRLEAMKMEHTIRTTADGVVEAIHYCPGDTVEADAQLVTLRAVSD